MTATTPKSLAEAALERISAAVADHQPGQPYILTREAFSRFWREELHDRSYPDADHADKTDLWVSIAGFEAGRSFQEGWDRCRSELAIDTAPGGTMQWWYETTSETQLIALDWRDQEPPSALRWEDVIDNVFEHLAWVDGSETHPLASVPKDGFYAVVIPADRDQPGRTAWTQIRLAMSGLSYRCWWEENEEPDDVGLARKSVKEGLSPDHIVVI